MARARFLFDCAPETRARFREAQAVLDEAAATWDKKIAKELESAKRRVSELLAKQSEELRQFHAESHSQDFYQSSPRVLGIIGRGASPMLFRAKVLDTTGPPGERAPQETARRRRQIVARHKSEIVQLNIDCELAIHKIEERRDRDLAAKRKYLERLRANVETRGEERGSVEGAVRPPKAASEMKFGRVVRLALGPFDGRVSSRV
jgi:hypothetical protein